MNPNIFILTLVLFFLLIITRQEKISLSDFVASNLFYGENGIMYDKYHRERYMRGVNYVKKNTPYYPENIPFSKLKKYGYNLIRLGVMWIGAMPTLGQINQDYIEKIKEIIHSCKIHGINVLVDAHQDVFNEEFCGDGSPPLKLTNGSFPLPISLDRSIKNHQKMCNSRPFYLFYFSYDVCELWEDLYNPQGKYKLQSNFILFWTKVSKTLKLSDNIVGYEIINEPFPGDVHKNLKLIVPSFATKRLSSFYKIISEAIRKNDEGKILFYESVTWSMNAEGFPDDLGWGYKNLTGISFHHYEPPNSYMDIRFENHVKTAKNLKIGLMMTEFFSYGDNKTIELANKIVDKLEKLKISFTAWGNTPSFEGEFDARNISRPYVIMASGELINLEVDKKNRNLIYKLKFNKICMTNNHLIYLGKNVDKIEKIKANFMDKNVKNCHFTFYNFEKNYLLLEHSIFCTSTSPITVIMKW